MHFLFIPIMIVLTTLNSCTSHDKPLSKSELEIADRSQAYQKALNENDVNTLIEFWADDAVYRNPLTGKLVQGKDNIKQEYIHLFKHISGTTVQMDRENITFPFEDKAVEEGIFHIQIPGQPAYDHDYKIIYVKRKGQWKILNVSEINIELPKNPKVA